MDHLLKEELDEIHNKLDDIMDKLGIAESEESDDEEPEDEKEDKDVLEEEKEPEDEIE